MRGIFSQAMVMCASSPELVEILDPPPGSVPGDKVICEGYPGTPDEQLNPKKKVRGGALIIVQEIRTYTCPHVWDIYSQIQYWTTKITLDLHV